MLPDRTWPFPVRPGSFETVDNYLRRLRTTNLVSDLAWGAWVKPTVRATGMPRADALPLITEAVAGLEPGHFARNHAALPAHADGKTCVNCVTGLEDRFGCARCTPGERVEQSTHDGPRVCRRHMMWVGPGTTPEQQRPVGTHVLRADRLYRRLRRTGTLDAHRLAEILACVDEWADASIDTVTRFVIAMRLAQAIFRPHTLDSYVSRDVEAGTRYLRLTAVIAGIVGTDDCIVLIDAVWLLLRAAGHQDQSAPHSFVCTPKKADTDERAELEQLRSSHYPRWRHLHRSQCVSSERAGTRYAREGEVSKQNTYVCSRGHAFIQRVHHFTKMKKAVGCRVCSNKVVLAGFNSLADTDPHLIASWHTTKNGNLRPDEVMAGSETIVFWVCPKGHSYKMSLIKRSRGYGCHYCSGSVADPTINAFSLTHPAIAAEWHLQRNGERTPEHFVPGSVEIVWWLCPEGHDYQMMIAKRTKKGGGCTYCSHQKAHPTTSLAVTAPETASRWHPSKNGTLSPSEVLEGSGWRVWWLCREGHEYLSAVYVQTRGGGCNICTGRVVDAQNCMRTTRPDLAREFHPSRNGVSTPDNVLATTQKRIWWLCKEGHYWRTSGANRASGGTGCPYCSNSKVWVGWNDMGTMRPDLVSEWDWDNNGHLLPQNVVATTNKRLAWKCSSCGHRWRATGADRARGRGCIQCARTERRFRRRS